MSKQYLVRELLNPPGNSVSVRLGILVVMSHSMLSTVIIAWQTSVLYIINPGIYKSVKKLEKKLFV